MDRRPLAAALGCYGIWGLITPLALYGLRALGAGPLEILSVRTLFCLPVAYVLILSAGQWQESLALFGRPRTVLLLALSASLIASNWGVYIWAIVKGAALETSLGYYLNPLLNMAAGALLFGERFDRLGGVAIGLAALGVGIQSAAVGHVPFIALFLALSFCGYGIVRKRVDAEALPGLFVECAVLALPGLLATVYLVLTGQAQFGHQFAASLAVPMMGPLTVVPLALFAWAARRMSLSALGFVQFLSPTLTFFLGLAAGETVSPLRLLSFAFIWLGVAVFLYSLWRKSRFGVQAIT